MEIWTAFLLGLIGSAHCAGMCGPLVLAMQSRRPEVGGQRSKVFAGRLTYNFGRIVTYCALGAVFGLFGKTILLAGFQRGLSIVLGVLLLIGLLASRKFALWRPITLVVERVKKGMALLLRRGDFTSQATLGLLNGLLPCGLVYVAAAGAAATGGIAKGALYMAAFGAGTLPMMLALSFSAKLIPFSMRFRLRKLMPVSVFVLGGLLILRGMALGIPYLSPDLTSSHGCCHP